MMERVSFLYTYIGRRLKYAIRMVVCVVDGND